MSMPLIIDTDPGIDDAIALMVALSDKNLDVRLITTVSGNVSAHQGAINALAIAEYLNVKVAVACGCESPILGKTRNSKHIHGTSGLGSVNLPAPASSYMKCSAVEAIRQALENSEEKVTILCLAAMTNIALFIRQYPSLLEKIERIVFMGGSLGLGNTNSAVEFNLFADPYAAQMVIEAPVRKVMVGLNTTNQAIVRADTINQIRDSGLAGDLIYRLLAGYNTRSGSVINGMPIHDLCALYYVVKPHSFIVSNYHVDVALSGPAAGATVIDIRSLNALSASVSVCTEVAKVNFNEWFFTSVRNMGH
ncbi:nucleoside hydrolase [Pectobacterium cacticida]|uniref:Nucleoside hydrolase n=1 Tax=Pectobacterium cacticida TaxID=69221 RepID=A0ABZ2GA57_9GAMM|nr:nucleoside hydrolase [Pectobacterium cacticida]UYX06907.1 nucleoside hydrolase [Pectobacterium cacticida]